jgi:hypothetical protein
MPIAISHLTEDDFYQRGNRLNSKRLLIESRKKLKYARDRKSFLPSVVEDSDFDTIDAQRALVRDLRQRRKVTAKSSLELTSAQEATLDALIKLNSRLMDLVDLAIRLKLLTGDGYRRGEIPGRTVKNWEDLAEERLLQAKTDKTTLMQVGLTDELLRSYEKAIEALATTDDEQESKKVAPGQAVRAVAIARGKLAYMMIWLCGVAEHALRDTPEEAKLFRVSDLLRERRVVTTDTTNVEVDEGDAKEPEGINHDEEDEKI